jgi:hypothetical protein
MVQNRLVLELCGVRDSGDVQHGNVFGKGTSLKEHEDLAYAHRPVNGSHLSVHG